MSESVTDMRLWNRDTISDLIDLYKDHPCLWKVSCTTYKNKGCKTQAYKELIQFCKKRGFPEATRDFVVRKIQSLRSSFRKELKKTLEANRRGQSYQPSLWYYNSLLFTKDQDYSSYKQRQNESGSEEETQFSDGLNYEEDEEKFEGNLESKAENCESPNASPSPPSSPKQKKKRTDHPQLEFLDVGQEGTYKQSEFDMFGMIIAKKLARMEEKQAIYAESIINSVIRKGLLTQLTEDTDLCENQCKGRILYNLPQSTSLP